MKPRNPVVRQTIANPKRNAGVHRSKKRPTRQQLNRQKEKDEQVQGNP